MKKIKLDGVEYEMCTSWDEVSLGKQIQVSIDSDGITNPVRKKISIISGYSNIPIDVLKKTQMNELPGLFKSMSFINEEIPGEPIEKFEFKGETYYVSQNLMNQEFQEFVSLENITQQYKDKPYLALPYILGIMCKKMTPSGVLETIDDYDIDKRSEEFKELNISIATGVAVFFSRSTNVLLNLSLLYSNPQQMVQEKINEVKNTLRKQAGQGWHIRFVNGILRSYVKYIEKRLNKYFTFSQ